MNTQAIERIKGYCCKVNEEQWEELVRVADEVGCEVGANSRKYGMIEPDKIARYNNLVEVLGVYPDKYDYQKEISFPDFLAKLRGEEKWQPKAGEMVEVAIGGRWFKAEFVVFHQDHYICNEYGQWQYLAYKLNQIRPILPTITRAEAEKQLGKRIID
jgi:hypothetical protein